MSEEWVTWKCFRTGGMGEKWRKSKLTQKWMKLVGIVSPTMLHISENLVENLLTQPELLTF